MKKKKAKANAGYAGATAGGAYAGMVTHATGDVKAFQKILVALKKVKKGDFRARLHLDRCEGVPLDVVEAFNDVIDLNQKLASEFRRISPAGR